MKKLTACATKTFKWPTLIGTVTIETCVSGLHQLQMLERTPEDQLRTNASSTIEVTKGSETVIEDVHAQSVVEWLDAFFGNKNSDRVQDWKKYPKICWTGLNMTEFKEIVLKTAVEKVKFGQTVSYGELATLCEKPNAGRAVGTAMKKNPIFLIIPCHRVIRSNGASGNYSGGKLNDIKEYLLKHEGKIL